MGWGPGTKGGVLTERKSAMPALSDWPRRDPRAPSLKLSWMMEVSYLCLTPLLFGNHREFGRSPLERDPSLFTFL